MLRGSYDELSEMHKQIQAEKDEAERERMRFETQTKILHEAIEEHEKLHMKKDDHIRSARESCLELQTQYQGTLEEYERKARDTAAAFEAKAAQWKEALKIKVERRRCVPSDL